jgi:hypothetical protein
MYWTLWLCLWPESSIQMVGGLKFLESGQVEYWELSFTVFKMLSSCPFQTEYNSLSLSELWPSVISSSSTIVSAFCSWFQKIGMRQDYGWHVGLPSVTFSWVRLCAFVQCGVRVSHDLCHRHFISLAWYQTGTLHWRWILMFVTVWSVPVNHKLFLVSRDLFSAIILISEAVISQAVPFCAAELRPSED